jgi:hypothetical protein
MDVRLEILRSSNGVGEIVGDFGMWFEILRSSKWSWRFWNVI